MCAALLQQNLGEKSVGSGGAVLITYGVLLGPCWSVLARIGDEDIPTHDYSPVSIQGPITRSSARQLQ
jgi:hypothetical protein